MQYYEGEGKMRYYDSPAWGEWCRRVYGIDLKQIGAVTKEELDVLFREVSLSDSKILDVGCGSGYMTDVVAKHFHSTAVGIDIDEFAIAKAKRNFSDNPFLVFQVADGNELSFQEASFDLICFFDTLYFTGTAIKLQKLLDKCMSLLKEGGKLIIFWSCNPMDGSCERVFDNTQVGLWGTHNNLSFQALDLSESNKGFWRRAMKEIIAMESDLRREIPETYKQVFDECIHAKSHTEDLFRWLYIFEK